VPSSCLPFFALSYQVYSNHSNQYISDAPTHLVMNACHTPHDTSVTVWVPAVQRVSVVQINAKLDGLLRPHRPLQDLFRLGCQVREFE